MIARICNTVAFLAPPARRSSDEEPDDAAMEAYLAREPLPPLTEEERAQIREQDRREIEALHREHERLLRRYMKHSTRG